MTLISIHQPVYLPWLGFFKKIISSEIFVFLDDIQYEKNGWHNRNKIKTFDGSMWLTVPVNSKTDVKLNEILIENKSKWSTKHSKSISINYFKSKYFETYWSDLELIYQKNHDRLINLNLEIINFILKKMNIKTKIVFSSELKISKSNSDRILEICKKLNADSYLSGIQGKNYLKLNDFAENKIDVLFQNFQHPVYSQLYEPFVSNLSSIDLLFNEGQNSYEILDKAKNF